MSLLHLFFNCEPFKDKESFIDLFCYVNHFCELVLVEKPPIQILLLLLHSGLDFQSWEFRLGIKVSKLYSGKPKTWEWGGGERKEKENGIRTPFKF